MHSQGSLARPCAAGFDKTLWESMANEVQSTSHLELLLSQPCPSDRSSTGSSFLKQNILLGTQLDEHCYLTHQLCLVKLLTIADQFVPVSRSQLLFCPNKTERTGVRMFSRIGGLFSVITRNSLNPVLFLCQRRVGYPFVKKIISQNEEGWKGASIEV